jgi:predicted nucleotidyltransferase
MTFDDDVDTIVDLIKEATIKKFSQEIDVILIYGSRARGDYESSSDLEMIAIVEDSKKTKVEWFFLYKGIPVDLWTNDWKGIENVDEGSSVLQAGTLSTAKVIYYKDKEAKNRFEESVKRVKNFTADEEKNLESANKIFSDIYKYLGKICFAKVKKDIVEARNNVWHIVISSVIILAKINNSFLLNTWGTNMYEVTELSVKPKNLISYMETLVSSDNFDVILSTAIQLIDSLRALMIEINKKYPLDMRVEFLCTEVSAIEYIFKIRKAVKHKDILAASYAVFELQSLASRDMYVNEKKWTKAGQFLLYNDFREKYDHYGFPDFTEAISSRDFNKLNNLSDNFEEVFLRYLSENDMKLKAFNNLEELKEYLHL